MESTESVVFTCPRCGNHTLQYRTLVPVYNDVGTITRKKVAKAFPMNPHDKFDYEDGGADCDNSYDYDHEIDDGLVCSECGASWKSLHDVGLAGCLQRPCNGITLDAIKNKPNFTLERQMKAERILGVNKDKCLVVLTHLIHNTPSLHSARIVVMQPWTMDEVNNAKKYQEPEACRSFWQEAVAAFETEDSLEKFSEDLKSNECGPGGKLFVGDDPSMRKETEAMFDALPGGTRGVLLQLMEVAPMEEPGSKEAAVPNEHGLLPVVAFTSEWSGTLAPKWVDDMALVTIDPCLLAIVNEYVGSQPMPEERNEDLHKAWKALTGERETNPPQEACQAPSTK